MRRQHPRRGRRGFTLVEVLLASVTVGLGLVALMGAVRSSSQVNGTGRKITQASFLAQEIREWTMTLPFSDPDPGDQDNPPGPDAASPQVFVDDLDDLMDVTYSPPRDGQGLAIAGMSGWSQTITLTWRSPGNLMQTVTPGTSDVINVQVDVRCAGQSVLTANWLVARRQDQ